MEFLKPSLKEFVDVYQCSIKDIRDIEDITAINAVNYQFANNLRHALEHFALALQKALNNPMDEQGSKDHLHTALSHIFNLAPDAYEYIAGVKLAQTRTHIEAGGFFADREKSKRLHTDAIQYYTQGRTHRTENPERAVGHFKKTIELCSEAINSVIPLTKVQKINLLISCIAVLATIATIILFFDKVFHFLPPFP